MEKQLKQVAQTFREKADYAMSGVNNPRIEGPNSDFWTGYALAFAQAAILLESALRKENVAAPTEPTQLSLNFEQNV